MKYSEFRKRTELLPAELKSGAGFTLVELLVVTAIIAFLSATFFINYGDTGKQFALQRAAYKLTQDIRRGAEMAMSAEECCGGIIPAGYGISLEEGDSSYILYADTQPPSGNEIFSGNDDIIQTIEMEEGIVIQDIDTSNGTVCINFKPPSPTIKIKYIPSSELDQVVIVLSSGGFTRTVRVNAVGLTEVE